jgi:putative membrane protein
MKPIHVVAAFGWGLTLASIAIAVDQPSTLVGVDQAFMQKAAAGSMMEVEAGRLAASQGQSAGVQTFGKLMVHDHTAASSKLAALASRKGVTLPQTLSATDQANLANLAAQKGPAFDQAYTAMMLSDHRDDVSAFEQEAQVAQDPDLKDFAAQTLVILKHHLELSEKLPAGSTLSSMN